MAVTTNDSALEGCDSSGEIGTDGKDAAPSPGLGTRHLQILLMFLGMMLGYSLRVSMSVAIVAMVDKSTANPNMKEYDWNQEIQGLLLSSFFWGYAITQVPSGYLARVWSARKVLALGLFFCGLVNAVIPVAGDYADWGAVCACRVIMGLCQGCLLPCIHTLLSSWVPPSERARLGTFAYAGAPAGMVIAMPISGLLAASALGWPSIFYIFGALGMCWGLAFFYYGADSPAVHSSISQEEKLYIEASLGTSSSEKENGNQEKLKIPWVKILTSLPMWALIITHCCQNWGYWILVTKIPLFMKSVLGFDIKDNGFYSALPYLAMWMLSIPISWLSDFALKKGATKGFARKVSNSIAFLGPAAALISLCFVDADNKSLAVFILVLAVAFNAGSVCGFQINHIDLSPNFAGPMMSITNCMASIVAILAPILASVVVYDEENVSLWHIIFYISAGIYVVGDAVFVLFGQGEVQPWNDPDVVPEKHKVISDKP
ncbi:putative inorganic phosphate cotransporter isoform X2 [Orussus abietinus]|uniref:putative inorganic phosphate cotransporter isoform X2 n=1 Tax=Orussus abietinus TaxID=222816 RepID=UPI000625372F|nr:putative inorganic phosphate cotransporter isoform X2 [Orussus abietinus]